MSTQFSLLGRPIATALALGLATQGVVTAAWAQGMEEIVTTARGRAESLQDVPASVTVIGADVIEKKGIQRVEDIVSLTPGMSIVNSAEVADTQVNIRGINGARDAEVNYALIVDGVLMTNPAALNREWSNLQQVEVLKGPQGALYGRNAAAGAIIMTTKRPEEELEGDVKVSLAEDSTYLLTGRIGGRTNNDAVAWQLAADYRDTDGFYEDIFQNADDVVDNFENWNVNGRLIWEASDKWTIDTKLRYGEVDAASITFNSVFHIPSLVPILEFFGQPPEMAAFGNENVNGHKFQFNTNIVSFNEQEALEFSIKSDYDLGWADLTGWFLYSDVDNNLGADGTSGAFGFFFADQLCIDTTNENAFYPLNPPQILLPEALGGPAFSVYGAYTPTSCDGTQYQERNQEDYSLEIRLTSKDDQRLRWQAGFYYLNIEREVGINLGIDTGNQIVKELFTTNPLNPTEQLIWDVFESDVYAVFGQLAYDVTEDIEASLALRYDREEREVTNLVPTDATTQFLVCDFGAPFTGGDPINPGLCLDPTGASANQSEDFDELQPKFSLRWDATERASVFASIGVGFKSGGFNNFGSAATVDIFINDFAVAGSGFPEVAIADSFGEETSTAFEIGFKSEIGDRFRWEGAYYHTVDDMQTFEFFVGQFGLLRVVSNVDEVTIDGFELSANWAATDWLNLYANGNWIDSEIDKNTSRPDTVGNESPYTPEYTFGAGAYFNWPITPSMNVIADVGLSGVGKTWFHAVQDQVRPTIFDPVFGTVGGDYTIAERDSYELVDVRVGLAGENWSLIAFAKNVFDEEWLQEVIPAPEFGGSFIHPGTESRFGVEATYSF
jgi:iron complex outermembrane receptor protein